MKSFINCIPSPTLRDSVIAKTWPPKTLYEWTNYISTRELEWRNGLIVDIDLAKLPTLAYPLVPLGLYAFRFKKGIPFSKWHPDALHKVVYPQLAYAMQGLDAKLEKVIREQTGPAHPSRRNIKTMLLDTKNWDNIPSPLITSNILNEIPTSHT